jgi:hypothetical protein
MINIVANQAYAACFSFTVELTNMPFQTHQMVGDGSVDGNGDWRGVEPHAVIIQNFKKQPQHSFSASTFQKLETKTEMSSSYCPLFSSLVLLTQNSTLPFLQTLYHHITCIVIREL